MELFSAGKRGTYPQVRINYARAGCSIYMLLPRWHLGLCGL